MQDLTVEQQGQLAAVLAELNTLPTPELIAEAGRLRCPLPLDDAGRARMRLALGGAYATGKVMSYIETLRAVDGQRDAIGRGIYQLRHVVQAIKDTDPIKAAESTVLAIHLSGRQEVMFHFFAVCAAQIARLLPVATKASGYKLPKADLDILDAYSPLRNYFEHLDARLPGRAHQKEVVTEVQDEYEWRIQMAFVRDNDGRIIIDGKAIDVTSRGVAAVEEVVQRTWEQLRTNCLEEVHKHFLRHPTTIPHPRAIRQDLLVSIDEQWADGSM